MDTTDNAVQKEVDRNDGVKPKRPKEAAKRKTKKRPSRTKLKRKAVKSKIVRSERLDMRLTKAEKAKVTAKAKKTRRTVTSLVIEAIEKIR